MYKLVLDGSDTMPDTEPLNATPPDDVDVDVPIVRVRPAPNVTTDNPEPCGTNKYEPLGSTHNADTDTNDIALIGLDANTPLDVSVVTKPPNNVTLRTRPEPSPTNRYTPSGSIASAVIPENEACVPTPSVLEYDPLPAKVDTARVDNTI